jgi:hypothetical protein
LFYTCDLGGYGCHDEGAGQGGAGPGDAQADPIERQVADAGMSIFIADEDLGLVFADIGDGASQGFKQVGIELTVCHFEGLRGNAEIGGGEFDAVEFFAVFGKGRITSAADVGDDLTDGVGQFLFVFEEGPHGMFAQEGIDFGVGVGPTGEHQDLIKRLAHRVSPVLHRSISLRGEVSMGIGPDGSLEEEELFSAEGGDDSGDAVAVTVEGLTDLFFDLLEGFAGQEGERPS